MTKQTENLVYRGEYCSDYNMFLNWLSILSIFMVIGAVVVAIYFFSNGQDSSFDKKVYQYCLEQKATEICKEKNGEFSNLLLWYETEFRCYIDRETSTTVFSFYDNETEQCKQEATNVPITPTTRCFLVNKVITNYWDVEENIIVSSNAYIANATEVGCP